MTRILAVSGSLRAGSINTELLKAAQLLTPPGVTVTLCAGLADVPAFNPDIDPAPTAVNFLRAQFAASDAFLFCTPEYAHGVPGALKNALDWLVASGELSQKRFALWNAAPRSHHAQDSLREIVTTMDARLVEPACASFTLPNRNMNAAQLAVDAHLSVQIRALLAALIAGAINAPAGGRMDALAG